MMNKVFHFSYHKCLTAYYKDVLLEFSSLKGFEYRHFDSQREKFVDAYQSEKISCASLNNTPLPIAMKANERGSHFVRDPRDLVVSGYYYHLWCPEPWVFEPAYRWQYITRNPLFKKWTGLDEWPQGICYQEFLKSLEREQGLVVEMLWRQHIFKQMFEWDYANPNILELKYENIIDNESEAFNQLFDHYQWPSAWRSDWIQIAARRSRKNLVAASQSHFRNGTAKQFESEFSTEVRDDFNILYNGLVEKLGYAA